MRVSKPPKQLTREVKQKQDNYSPIYNKIKNNRHRTLSCSLSAASLFRNFYHYTSPRNQPPKTINTFELIVDVGIVIKFDTNSLHFTYFGCSIDLQLMQPFLANKFQKGQSLSRGQEEGGNPDQFFFENYEIGLLKIEQG